MEPHRPHEMWLVIIVLWRCDEDLYCVCLLFCRLPQKGKKWVGTDGMSKNVPQCHSGLFVFSSCRRKQRHKTRSLQTHVLRKTSWIHPPSWDALSLDFNPKRFVEKFPSSVLEQGRQQVSSKSPQRQSAELAWLLVSRWPGDPGLLSPSHANKRNHPRPTSFPLATT